MYLPDYAMADSIFGQKGNKDKLYEFEGEIYKGSELNYYLIGAVMRRNNHGSIDSIGLVYAWKATNMIGNLGYLVRGENLYWFPSKGELYFMSKGYIEYNGTNYDYSLDIYKFNTTFPAYKY